LPAGTAQFYYYKFSKRRRKAIEKSTIGRDGKWNFPGNLKLIGEFDPRRRIEAIDIKRNSQGRLWGLRDTGAKNKRGEKKDDRRKTTHERYYKAGL
jgi:hypothetical protein